MAEFIAGQEHRHTWDSSKVVMKLRICCQRRPERQDRPGPSTSQFQLLLSLVPS